MILELLIYVNCTGSLPRAFTLHRITLSTAHAQDQPDPNAAFAIGIALNIAFVIVEAVYGFRTGSLALLADAGHNLGDVAGLALAWMASWAARLRPDRRHTYGWQRAGILAAFLNAALLLVAMGSLGWEAARRFTEPQPLASGTVMVVAAIGIGVNTATALLFLRGRQADLNIRGAFLHMMSDALVSLGVVVSGGAILWLGWIWLDPVVALAIAVVIAATSVKLLGQSLHLLFDGVPDGLDVADLDAQLRALPGVTDVTDLHVWAMGPARTAMTAHLVMPAAPAEDYFVQQASRLIGERFGIRHVTLQITRAPVPIGCGAAQSP